MEANYLRTLLERLAEKTGQSMDTAGFLAMGELIEEQSGKGEKVSGRYLQENIYNKLQKGGKDVPVRQSKIDVIARYLGHENFTAFVRSIDTPLSPVVSNCSGNWYSYVRTNSGNLELLRAPVRIWIEKNKLKMALLGRERRFEGEVSERNGNVFAQLDSGEHKALTIVLKVGISKNPQVLQGVFAGISSNGDPICGREILVRQEEKDPGKLSWKRIRMEDVLQEEKVDRRIIDYFRDYRDNCIKINRVSNFDLDDLMDIT